MKVHLLEKAIEQFLSAGLTNDATDWYYPHSLVGEFQAHWTTPSPEVIEEIYNQVLRSEYSQRWWKREQYRPKEIMLSLIQADPELAAIAWKDLANEDASLDGRLSRFEYYCDELLKLHRQKHFRSVETYHHQDASIVSLYLAGLCPEKYALYPGLDIFQNFCRVIGSPDIPKVDDLVRYMKVAAIVNTFLQRNSKYVLLIAQRDPSRHKVRLIPFLISYEVIAHAGGNTKYETG